MTENFVTREDMELAIQTDRRITVLEQSVVSIKWYMRAGIAILGIFMAIALALFVQTQNEIDTIRIDIAYIKEDVATLKTDVAVLKTDVAALQVGQQQIFTALRNEGIIK